MIHKISDVLNVNAGASSGPGLAAVSKTAAAYNLPSIDVSLYEGGFAYNISAGGISGGATVDAKIQDSADNSTFADVSGLAITQITASGEATLDVRTRQLRRYARLVVTVGTATTVVGVVFVGQKKTP